MARPLTPREVTEMLLADRMRNGSLHGNGGSRGHANGDGKRRGRAAKRAPAATDKAQHTQTEE